MADAVSKSLAWPKLGVLLMATFGIAGLVLAASGAPWRHRVRHGAAVG